MRRIISLVILMAFICGTGLYAQDTQKAKETPKQKKEIAESKKAPKFDPTRDSEKDLAEAIAKTKENGKYILLDVGGEWCIWCKRLDIFLYDNEELHKMLTDAFEVVKVNYSEENRNETFLSKFPKIPGYPHFFILDKKGKFMQSQDTGVLESGGTYSYRKLISFLTIWGIK